LRRIGILHNMPAHRRVTNGVTPIDKTLLHRVWHFGKSGWIFGHRKHLHPFMGLLKCGLCGCTMTAERKKGKYVYYRCTGFRGACGNVYIREEKLAALLCDVIRPVQITPDVAANIATAIRESDGDVAAQRVASLQQVEQRRRTVISKLDRGYEDFASGRISEAFWTRKSVEWEAELQTVDAERARLERTHAPAIATAEKILELAKKAQILYQSQNPTEQRRLLETVLSNCTFDRGTLSPTYTSPFDLLVKGNETGNWRAVWDEFRNFLTGCQPTYLREVTTISPPRASPEAPIGPPGTSRSRRPQRPPQRGG
jgi:hypothetical protein